jgi:hypothetical protein
VPWIQKFRGVSRREGLHDRKCSRNQEKPNHRDAETQRWRKAEYVEERRDAITGVLRAPRNADLQSLDAA